ncbi:MAG: hypothetical protein ABIN36_19135 [Ferruginibacter sp.]
MKNIIASLLLLLFTQCSFSQSVYPYGEIKLEKPADYVNAEPMAMNAVKFLLTTPYKKDDSDRNKAFLFLVNWTKGATDYHFELRGVILELRDNREIMSLLIPAMVKFCLENKTLASNLPLIEASAVKTVLDYCNDPTKNFVLTKKLRKKLEAN